MCNTYVIIPLGANMYLSFIQDWWIEIVVFVKSIQPLAFASIISLLAVGLLICLRYIIKNSFNVNAYKKNLTFPILFSILIVGLIILLSIAYA